MKRTTSCCKGFDSCLEKHIKALESNGQTFFEEKEEVVVSCYAKGCQWNVKGSRCSMAAEGEVTIGEDGRCLDFLKR